MPTYNRREFIPFAIRYFLRQDYSYKELIVIDDGTDAVSDLIPDVANIRYIRLDQKITLGAKLNMACSLAMGSILALWDDDDWYAPRRLTYQVEALEIKQTDVCGINQLLYYDLVTRNAYVYRYPANQQIWISSLCFTKGLWKRNPFADINVGMDGLFIWATAPDRITVLADSTISVHMIHHRNVSPKQTNGHWWHAFAVENIRDILQADWHDYANAQWTVGGSLTNQTTVREVPAAPHSPNPVRNVYACLVHEREDCILDLVRNLNYIDPDSPILLYNGSDNPSLLKNQNHWEQFGAVVYPSPRPMQHGYLHSFALDSMTFALTNFAFDTLTIVDSDQLALRTGYPAYLGSFLTSWANVGLLSSRPERLSRTTHDIWPVQQAFEEYDLWKPWLRRFAGGESKFVHWTFWPSTVFTADAARDLTRLFRTDSQLQQIMTRTKIWATEEIVLPTLIRLLDYDIIKNPCSDAFVQYRKTYSIREVDRALTQPDVYWIHPVERQYENSLRIHVRQRFNQYVPSTENAYSISPPHPDLFLPVSLLSRLKTISGWLSDPEAELLMAIAIKVCQKAPEPPVLVEIGSYHGKSTILLGNIVKAFRPEARIVTIDPHDGQLGAVDQGLQSFPPSLSSLKTNLANADIANIVEVVQAHAYELTWQMPVTLLLIDGLHDYASVARDFWHFAEHIQPGGYVVFHDYADYYPGVQAFVQERLAEGIYQKIFQAESLIVLQKQ